MYASFTKSEVHFKGHRLVGFKAAFFFYQFYKIILAQFQVMTKVNLPISLEFPGKLIIVLVDHR